MPELRKIALIDLDAFFASVEVLKDPTLAHVPFAVGGQGQRGVVATCNYLAREFGVRSAMSSFQAKQLCPHLRFVPVDHARYRQVSQRIYQLLLEYTPDVEAASIDEFYLDLSQATIFKGSATYIVQDIRNRIRHLGITASAGISNQKMVAKIASDDQKPDGQTVIAPEQVLPYIAQLTLNRIPGVGPKTHQKLNQAGFYTGQDIQQSSLSMMQHLLGEKHGYRLYQRCHGIDNRPVQIHTQRKQISVEETLTIDLFHYQEAQLFLEAELIKQLQQRMHRHSQVNSPIQTQTVKLKFSDFKQTTVSRSSVRLNTELFSQLLEEAWQRRQQRGVRLIGIGVTLAEPEDTHQLELHFP